jgi:hypothetical protein
MKLLNKKEIKFTTIADKKVFISSYSYENLNKDITSHQENVFNKFKIDLNQFVGKIRHAEFMDYIMSNIDSEIYVFFDVDCIPLKEGVIEFLVDKIKYDSMIGIEQQCNSLTTNEHIYAGPACFAITKTFYEQLGKPSFSENRRSDVGEELTFISESKNKEFHLLEKKSSEDNIWKLKGGRFFGHGTIYGDDLVYHQFEIRKFHDKFIKRCKEIIES